MKKSLIILLLFLAGQVVTGIIASAMGWLQNYRYLGYCTLAADLVVIALLWRLRLAGEKSAYGKTCCLLKGKMWLAVCGVIFMAFGVNIALEPLDLNDLGMTEAFDAMRSDVLCILMLCIVGPLVEELVFRDGILRHLALKGIKPLWAIVISSVLFGLVHGDPAQMVPATLLGLVLGLLYVHTGNLSLCLPAHIANNTLAIGLMYVPGSEEWTKDLSVPAHIALGLPLLIVGALLIYYITRKNCARLHSQENICTADEDRHC